jgi:hypothetical protein
MVNLILTTIILFLILLNIAMIILAYSFHNDLIRCETNESPYCPNYVCPSDKDPTTGTPLPAQRKRTDGSTQYSTPTGQPPQYVKVNPGST